MINVLAVDPGLATFGAVVVQTDGQRHRALRAGVFLSKSLVSDFSLRACDDRVRRARELDVWLDWFTCGVDVQVVAAEAMSFPRGTDPIVCISLAWGVLASFLSTRRLKLVSATPSYWRTRLLNDPPTSGGTRTQQAQRTEDRERRAHAVVVRTVPSLVSLVSAIRPPAAQVHALDAGGVFTWAVTTPLVRELTR